jgi:glycosyltransferase involved in cell wall biosynthesis
MTVDPIGGVWTYAIELARALEAHGIEIALASMGAHLTPEQYQQVLARKNLRLFESGYRLEWMVDPWDDVDRAGDWLLKIAERFRPDLVHLNGYSHATLSWDAPVLVVAHSCVLSWWHAVKNAKRRNARCAGASLRPTRQVHRHRQWPRFAIVRLRRKGFVCFFVWPNLGRSEKPAPARSDCTTRFMADRNGGRLPASGRICS